MEHAQSLFRTGLKLVFGNCDLAEKLSHNKGVHLTSALLRQMTQALALTIKTGNCASLFPPFD